MQKEIKGLVCLINQNLSLVHQVWSQYSLRATYILPRVGYAKATVFPCHRCHLTHSRLTIVANFGWSQLISREKPIIIKNYLARTAMKKLKSNFLRIKHKIVYSFSPSLGHIWITRIWSFSRQKLFSQICDRFVMGTHSSRHHPMSETDHSHSIACDQCVLLVTRRLSLTSSDCHSVHNYSVYDL